MVTDQATKQGPKYPIILERIFSPDYVFVSFKKSKKKTFLELIGCQETPPPPDEIPAAYGKPKRYDSYEACFSL